MHCGTRLVLFALGALLMPHFAAAQDEEVEMVVLNRGLLKPSQCSCGGKAEREFGSANSV